MHTKNQGRESGGKGVKSKIRSHINDVGTVVCRFFFFFWRDIETYTFITRKKEMKS